MNSQALKEVFLYLPAKLIEGIAGIVMIALYSRLLSPGEYGQYGFINSFVMMSYILVVGWLMHSSYRNINKPVRNQEKKEFYSTVWIAWILLQAVFLGMITILYLSLPTVRSWMALTGLMFLPYSGVQLLMAHMSGLKKVGYALLLSTATILLKLLLAWIFNHLTEPLMAVVLAHGLADALFFSIVIIRTGVQKNIKLSFFNKSVLKDFYQYGIPLTGMALSMSIINMSDRFIIGLKVNEAAAGFYTANYTIASASFTLIMVGVIRAFYPNILRSFEHGMDRGMNSVWEGLRIFLMLGLPGATGLVILSNEVSTGIVEAQYAEASPIIGFVAISMLILGISEYLIKPLELAKKTRPIFKASISAAIVNLSLNFLLIPVYGYMAAGVTTLIAYVAYVAVILYGARTEKRVPITWLSVLRIGSASLAMGLFVHYAKGFISNLLSMGAVILISAVLYFVLLTLTHELDDEYGLIFSRIRKG